MHAELASGLAPAGRYPTAVVASRTARRAVRSGALSGYIFGATVASSAWGYASAYQTPAQRDRLAALFGSNTGLAAINGPAREIQTVAGYTVWKSFMFLIIVGAVWGLLTGTRLLRGEEDTGRWELLLAGQTTRRRAAGQALAGLGAGLATLWALTAVITVVAGRTAAGRHLGRTNAVLLRRPGGPRRDVPGGRRTGQPAGRYPPPGGRLRGAVLGVCYALRMVADSGTGLEWLHLGHPARLGRRAPAAHRPLPAGAAADRRARHRPRLASACTLRGLVISAPAPSPTATGRRRGPGCWRGRPGWRCAWCARPCWPGRQRSPSGRCCWVPSPSRAGAPDDFSKRRAGHLAPRHTWRERRRPTLGSRS